MLEGDFHRRPLPELLRNLARNVVPSEMRATVPSLAVAVEDAEKRAILDALVAGEILDAGHAILVGLLQILWIVATLRDPRVAHFVAAKLERDLLEGLAVLGPRLEALFSHGALPLAAPRAPARLTLPHHRVSGTAGGSGAAALLCAPRPRREFVVEKEETDRTCGSDSSRRRGRRGGVSQLQLLLLLSSEAR